MVVFLVSDWFLTLQRDSCQLDLKAKASSIRSYTLNIVGIGVGVLVAGQGKKGRGREREKEREREGGRGETDGCVWPVSDWFLTSDPSAGLVSIGFKSKGRNS